MIAQLVMIRGKKIVNKGKQITKSKETYFFQVQSTGSKHWFFIDIDWLEEKSVTREPDFFNRLFQRNIEGQAVKRSLNFLLLL